MDATCLAASHARLPGSRSAVAATSTPFENTSGTSGPVPPEIARLKWNWGAFGLTIIWLWFHTNAVVAFGYLFFLFFVQAILSQFILPDFVRLLFPTVMSVIFGLVGHRIAWRCRAYGSLQHYLDVEKQWSMWGICMFVMLQFLWLLMPLATRFSGGVNALLGH